MVECRYAGNPVPDGSSHHRFSTALLTEETEVQKESKKTEEASEDDLLAEVQRLRAENEYLKNLQALVWDDKRC